MQISQNNCLTYLASCSEHFSVKYKMSQGYDFWQINKTKGFVTKALIVLTRARTPLKLMNHQVLLASFPLKTFEYFRFLNSRVNVTRVNSFTN